MSGQRDRKWDIERKEVLAKPSILDTAGLVLDMRDAVMKLSYAMAFFYTYIYIYIEFWLACVNRRLFAGGILCMEGCLAGWLVCPRPNMYYRKGITVAWIIQPKQTILFLLRFRFQQNPPAPPPLGLFLFQLVRERLSWVRGIVSIARSSVPIIVLPTRPKPHPTALLSSIAFMNDMRATTVPSPPPLSLLSPLSVSVSVSLSARTVYARPVWNWQENISEEVPWYQIILNAVQYRTTTLFLSLSFSKSKRRVSPAPTIKRV